MIADEIRDLSVDEIENRLDDTREELMNLRFRAATGELTDTNQLRVTRRLVARLLTILKEKEGEVEGEG
ncbi:MAG TPA: 50S ribosomal protein L29 [Anaerolineales bacterium]|nr:50S ribosomal protein L29 [Anaerolineales bacterium]